MSLERLVEAQPIMAKVFTHFQGKAWLGVVIAILFDLDKQPAYVAIFCLIIIDFLTGVGAAKYRGVQIKSAKIFRTAVKILTYFGALAAGHLLEATIGFNVGADDILIVFFGATEFISILENMARLGFKTPERLLNMAQDIRDNAGKHPDDNDKTV